MAKGLPTRALKAAFLQAMDKHFGNITASAKSAGISRAVVYTWMKKDAKFRQKVESSDYEEAFLDVVDSKLAKLAIIDENPTVLMFIAKTKGKKRGYVERSEISGPDGRDLEPARILTKQEAQEYLTKLENEY